MARGVYELKQELAKNKTTKNVDRELSDLQEIHRFLNSFYMSRIGIRVLIGQHIALHEHEEGWVRFQQP